MKLYLYVWVVALVLACGFASAEDKVELEEGYTIQAGDVLHVSVWKEEDMQREVLVSPDGSISFPLAGDLSVKGLSVSQVRADLVAKISRYIPDPSISVSIIKVAGNKIYILGQVNKPGEFVIDRQIDVMQALSMAGGTTAFADVKDIKILRRDPLTDIQSVMKFNYKRVSRGQSLNQNIILKSGDTVMVP